jgi:hypothetical protein
MKGAIKTLPLLSKSKEFNKKYLDQKSTKKIIKLVIKKL